MRKKIINAILACLITFIPTANVYADRTSDSRNEQAWAASQLDATYAQIDSLYAQKQQLQSEIQTLDANLVNLMVSIQSLESDIHEKEKIITSTKENLKKAQKAKIEQYEATKKRIQYIYEKGGDDAWFHIMLNAENLSDMLTKAEYTQKMYDYDRKNLEKYANTIKEIKMLEEKYKQEKTELETMKAEQEAESVNLQAAINERHAISANCDDEIAYAQQMANDYTALIQQQQAEIELLEAERLAAEEAERIATEEAVSTDASDEPEEASEEHDKPESEYNDNDDVSYDKYGNVIDSENTIDASEIENTWSSSGAGSSVVDYATQFVGNPYVWGGTSLTNGADCSGFVQSVYKNFGVELPRTSYEQQTAGQEVSYSEAQPGDLICYGGHVAIYMGDGKIVHASNAKDGIKISNDAAYRTILSVRRLV
ncbi:NlpC/P60 family protein [Frisingicoccus sp.]|uniref:C40 family peptidase n=1 Tax=Frisingicoccus sp. TaxID=1918627 RepID=UPI0039995A21